MIEHGVKGKPHHTPTSKANRASRFGRCILVRGMFTLCMHTFANERIPRLWSLYTPLSINWPTRVPVQAFACMGIHTPVQYLANGKDMDLTAPYRCAVVTISSGFVLCAPFWKIIFTKLMHAKSQRAQPGLVD